MIFLMEAVYLPPEETVNFLRPFARRRAKSLRPLAVAVLDLKPCVFLRRRLLGWYVRLLMLTSILHTTNTRQLQK